MQRLGKFGTVIAFLLASSVYAWEPQQQTAVDWIAANEKGMVEISKSIWNYAELSLAEHKSAKLLADELEKAGFRVERGVAGLATAFVATYGSGKPVIGIMAEYDAIPEVSQQAVPYRAPIVEWAPGHGCGHNLFAGGTLAAAIAVKTAMEKHRIPGTLRLYGTPAEEIYVGKVFMARDGLFRDVDAMMSWHPGGAFSAGGGRNMAFDSIKFIFRGESGGLYPWMGRNALDAAEVMNATARAMRERLYLEDKSSVDYVILRGGQMPTVVPTVAEVWYNIHGPNRTRVEAITEKVKDIARAAAQSTGNSLEIQFIVGNYEYLPNLTFARIIDKNLRQFAPPQHSPEEEEFARKIQATMDHKPDKLFNDNIEPPREGSRGGTAADRGDVSWITPLGHIGGGTYPVGTLRHSWQQTAVAGMSIGQKAMIAVAKTIAASTIDVLTKPDELAAVRKEFAERTKDFTYKPPLTPGQKAPTAEEIWGHLLPR